MAKVTRCASMLSTKFDSISDADYIEQLSKGDYAAFCDWVAEIGDIIVPGFSIKIATQHCEAGCVAEIETDFNYRRARVAICPQFHLFDGEIKRRIFAHELAHAVVTCMKMPYEALSEIVSQDVWTTTDSTALRQEEHWVSHLEGLLAPVLPLPPSLTVAKKSRRRKAT